MIQIHPAKQPDGVLGGEPTAVGIIIPEGVIIKPCFPVIILPLHTQVLLKALEGMFGGVLEQHLAPSGIAGAPDDIAVGVAHFFGHARSIALEVIYVGFACRGSQQVVGAGYQSGFPASMRASGT